jgi:hypothetical protein
MAFNDLHIYWGGGPVTRFYSDYDPIESEIYWDMHSRDGGIREVFPEFSRQSNAVVIAFPVTTTTLYYLYADGTGVFGDETFYWAYRTRHGEIELYW